MGQTRVVNRRRESFDIYIGRPSKWGNPWPIPASGRTPDTERRILGMYEAHVRASPALMAALPELRGKVLGCWCKPAACHGDVLMKLLEELG